MKKLYLVLILSLIGCASYYKKSTLETNYVTSYRFGCLDVMWEEKNFCKDDDKDCIDQIQLVCNLYEERFKQFLKENSCFYENGTPCFKEKK